MKKLFALLLAVVMFFSALPVNAFATDMEQTEEPAVQWEQITEEEFLAATSTEAEATEEVTEPVDVTEEVTEPVEVTEEITEPVDVTEETVPEVTEETISEVTLDKNAWMNEQEALNVSGCLENEFSVEDHPFFAQDVLVADVGDNMFQENEPNGTLATSNLVYSDYTVVGTTPKNGYDLDYYALTVTQRSTIIITSVADTRAFAFMLCDSKGNNLKTAEDMGLSGNYYADGIGGTVTPGTYYVCCLEKNNAYTSYMIYFNWEPVSSGTSDPDPITPPTTSGDGTTPAKAVYMTPDASYTKSWTKDNDHLVHYTKFTLDQRGIVTFSVDKTYDSEGKVSSYDFLVADENGDTVFSQECYKSKDDIRSVYQFSFGLEAGTYYLSMDPNFTVKSGVITGSYGYTFEANEFCEVEPNETAATATEIQLGRMYPAFFGPDGANYSDYDYWKVYTEKGRTYRISVQDFANIQATTTIMKFGGCSLYDLEYRTKVDAHGNSYMEYTASSTGWQYLYLYNYNGKQYSYGLMFTDVTPPSVGNVKNLSATTTYNSVTLNWDPVEGATGYRVWRNTSSGWKQLTIVDKPTFKETGRSAASRYYYAIQAIIDFNGKTYYGEYAYLYAYTQLANLKGLTSSPSSTSIKLSWSKVKNASGYIVYRYDAASDSYKKVTSTTKLYATDSKRSSGTDYEYRVRAYTKVSGKTVYSEYAYLSTSTKPANVSSFKASTTADSVTLTWKKVKGANGYLVYRYNSSSKKWSKISQTSELTFTDTERKAGTKYQYRIRAYKEVGDSRLYSSSYTTLTVYTKPATVTNVTASSIKKTSLKLKWSKASGATGYMVYRYDAKKGTWKKIGTTSKTYFSDSKLKSGTEYQYKVRAYKKVSKKNYYAEYSDIFITNTK